MKASNLRRKPLHKLRTRPIRARVLARLFPRKALALELVVPVPVMDPVGPAAASFTVVPAVGEAA
jgi:hypothetical protein